MPVQDDVFYSLGDWLRGQQSRGQRAAQSISRPRASLFENTMLPTPSGALDLVGDAVGGVASGFGRLTGQTAEPVEPGPVGSDGVPEMLRAPDSLRPDPMLEIEKALAGRAFAPEIEPATVEQSVAASQPSGQVRATIGGKTYDYSGGRDGGAPSLYDLNDGPQNASAFGQDYSPTGGSVSVMNENPQNLSLGQLQDRTALERARPASVPGAPAGMTQGEVLDIQKAGFVASQDPKARTLAEKEALRLEGMRDLQTLEAALRQQGRPEEQIRERLDAAARDLFLMLGFREGEYGALGSYLKPTGLPLG